MRRISIVLVTLGLAAVCASPQLDAPSAAGSRDVAPVAQLAMQPTAGSILGPTSWRALNLAIHALPTYHRRWARWVVGGPGGYWSTTNWYTNVIYIHRDVPK